MKKNLCWLVFCIDKSGSMTKIKDDMIGGFNSYIDSQIKANLGEARVFGYAFDTYYETLFENVDINLAPRLDATNYVPRGGTALYDSLGKTITDIGKRLADLAEADRPEKVLVITITDGEDNSHLSGNEFKQYSSTEVKDMVKHQSDVYNWDFAYIGANQDVWAVGASMGITGSASNLGYVADKAGTAYAFDNLAKSSTFYRSAVSAAGGQSAGVKFAFVPTPADTTAFDSQQVVAVKTPKKKKA